MKKSAPKTANVKTSFGLKKKDFKEIKSASDNELEQEFISSYWKSFSNISYQGKLEYILYFFIQGWRTITAIPVSSIITVFTISIALFLLSGFILILRNVDQILGQAGQNLSMTVFLKPEANEQDIQSLYINLTSDPRIKEARLVSKKEALEELKKDLGPTTFYLEGIMENPLPVSFDLVLRNFNEPAVILDSVAKEIRSNAVVDEVVYGVNWVEKTQGVISLFRLLGMITFFITLGVIAFLISNTIKLVIYARRDEIGIMQLVGAKDNFIRLPFLIAGLMEGFIGSVCSLALLGVAYFAVRYKLSSSVVFGLVIPEAAFLDIKIMFAVIILGLVIGGFGSLMAIGKFMNI